MAENAGAAAANLEAEGKSPLLGGNIVLAESQSAALESAGYVAMGTVTTAGRWRSVAAAGAPSARRPGTTLWTGTDLIVWGGSDGITSVGGTYLYGGAVFNAETETWTAIEVGGEAFTRENHFAIWTGTEMIIWGGMDRVGNVGLGWFKC
jgi:hypothetical protein